MPANENYLSPFYIKLDGKPAPKEIMDSLIEIVVEDNLHLPDMFIIQLHDSGLKWTNSDLFAMGKPVEISAQSPQPHSRQLGNRTLLMDGEITGLEPDLSENGVPTLTIRGYDRAYRLHQGRRTRSFLKSTDSEIVQRLAEEVKLKTDNVKPTNTIHAHVVQNNQTNMEFLLSRARRLGYDFFVEGETLFFGPPESVNSQRPKLSWGANLLSFRPCLSIVHQVDEVVVRGWDPLIKREIVGRAMETNSHPQVAGAKKAEQHFKGSNQVLISQPVENQAEADTLAQGLRDELGGQLIQAEGVCLGDPQIGAGSQIEIEGLGSQFDGKYFITAAIHAYRTKEVYRTSFTIGGREPQTLSALLGRNSRSFDPSHGVVVGIVTNNKDPEELGRIKVKYPGLDDLDESPWVRIASPMAGEKRGFYYLPEVNDEVLIAFEQGNVHRPYMLGMLWNGPDKPPKTNEKVIGSDGKVNQRILRSRSGHEIVLDDTSGQEKIIISDRAGNTITMAKDSMTIKVKADLEIEAGGKITIRGKSIDLN